LGKGLRFGRGLGELGRGLGGGRRGLYRGESDRGLDDGAFRNLGGGDLGLVFFWGDLGGLLRIFATVLPSFDLLLLLGT
jgi:hypothetical protein